MMGQEGARNGQPHPGRDRKEMVKCTVQGTCGQLSSTAAAQTKGMADKPDSTPGEKVVCIKLLSSEFLRDDEREVLSFPHVCVDTTNGLEMLKAGWD
ncbi:Hypp5093 [Branchiostoma lanceolatum]|uniref:Hypp5093 protein n=1 Tax=Branchiostoma lanceolatum TaxID=7740 RepID=A0A8K0AG84_BRALA|nr:Hypp5093 [Branchiostoma lanceolatum]